MAEQVAETPSRRAVLAADGVGLWCVAGYAALAVLARQPGEPDLRAFFLLVAWTGLPVFGLFFRFRRSGEPFPVGRLFFWVVAFRLCGLIGGPFYEDDFYRYLWDGYRFAVAGTPYGAAPEDFFVDPAVPALFQGVLDGVNYPELPTIYAPVTQVVFLLAYWIEPGSVAALQAILIAVDIAVVALLLRLAPARNVLLYAWCPLVVKEVAFTAHPDGVGVCLLLAAVVLARNRRWWIAAALLGLAVATKAFAVVLAPLILLRARPAVRGRSACRTESGQAPVRQGATREHIGAYVTEEQRSRAGCMAARMQRDFCRGLPGHWLLFAATAGALYLPFAVRGGADLFSLGVFARDWEFNSAVFGLLRAVVPPSGARILSGLVFAVFWGLCCLRRARSREGGVPRGDVLFGVLLAVSPVINPWYLLWLLPFAVVSLSIWAWTASVAVLLSYVTGLNLPDYTLQPYEQPVWARVLEFGLILAALAADVALRRRNEIRKEVP